MTLFRKSIVGPAHDSLLIRYVIFRIAAFGIYLHNMKRSDHDRALHDHPWPFVSVVLRGGYWEVHDQTLEGHQVTIPHRPGSVLVRPAEWRHRFVLPVERHKYKESWTLVIVGRRVRRWGFFTPSGWCWWRKYDSDRDICGDEVIWEGGKD